MIFYGGAGGSIAEANGFGSVTIKGRRKSLCDLMEPQPAFSSHLKGNIVYTNQHFYSFSLDTGQYILYNIKLIVYIQILFTKGRYIMAQEILLTSAGLKELEAELEDLRVRGRQEIKEKIQVALSFGDLSENSEYEEARNDQGKLEARISEIEAILSMAKIIDEDALSTDIIQMGSKVTIKDVEYGDIYKYQIISSTSTSKDKGVDYLTSDESPVAKALIGHAVGDIIEVEAPIGIIKYEVVEINK
mgnify:CR=1 FL=1